MDTTAPTRSLTLPRFLGFDIEVSAACNAKCTFCPQHDRGVRRRRPHLSPTLLGALAPQIEDLLSAQRAQHGRGARSMLGFCGMGEPLLKADLIFEFLRGFGGDAPVFIITNATHLTEAVIAHPLFERITRVVVSMTGWEDSYRSTYQTDFHTARDNALAAHRRWPGKVAISAVNTPDVPRADLASLAAYWRRHGVHFAAPPLHSRGGHVAHPAAYPGRFRDFASCSIFSGMNFVSSDGELLACCHDVVSDHVIGDLQAEPLATLIARKQARQASRRAFDVCGRCTDFTDFG